MPGFDHHCKWLNNCIGQPNYLAFLCLIWTFQGFKLVSVITAVWWLGALMEAPEATAAVSAGYVACTMCLGVEVLVGGLNACLMGFHVYLKCKGMTTYAYYFLKVSTIKKSKVYSQDELEAVARRQEKLKMHFEPFICQPSSCERQSPEKSLGQDDSEAVNLQDDNNGTISLDHSS